MNYVIKKIKQIIEIYRDNIESPSSEWYPVVIEVYKLIVDNLFKKELSVEWIEERIENDKNSLSTKFKLNTGLTIKSFIQHHRIHCSMKLFHKIPEVTVGSISFVVGYNYESTFCKAFRRETDLTPTEWREKNDAD